MIKRDGIAIDGLSSRDGLTVASVLVIGDEALETSLRARLPAAVGLRFVATTSETEGIGIDLVVIGGRAPITEAVEVGVHPTLFDKPVVLIHSEQKRAGFDRRLRDLHLLPANADDDTLSQAVMGLLSREHRSLIE